MERAANVRVLEVPYNWNDVGDWRALATLLERDADGNAIQGHVISRDTRGSIVISDDGGIVATLGVRRPRGRPLWPGDPRRAPGPPR